MRARSRAARVRTISLARILHASNRFAWYQTLGLVDSREEEATLPNLRHSSTDFFSAASIFFISRSMEPAGKRAFPPYLEGQPRTHLFGQVAFPLLQVF